VVGPKSSVMPIEKMGQQSRVAVVYGVMAGSGGLGLHAATVLDGIARGEARVHALGPGHVVNWPLPGGEPPVTYEVSPQFIPSWAARYTWLRWYQGQFQLQHDRRLGCWAAIQVQRLRPQHCYLFTQIALETLRWARRAGVSTTLDNPNGHIRSYHEVCQGESLRWCGRKYWGHPNMAMVERVEEEYHLADRIRVSSEWAKRSMTAKGVPASKIHVVTLPINLLRFRPCGDRMPTDGPLRVCYVGRMNLGKGFIYLLRAIRMLGPDRISLEVVGATGDRWCRRLLERERDGLMIKCAPGDPIPAYHRAEVFVLPSLHDGFGFVVAEAMACGLPVIVTDNCGAADWVQPNKTGWVVPAGQAEALGAALEDAIRRRKDLASMGRLARYDVESRGDPEYRITLGGWFNYQRFARAK
jgi:glycosyltransferase involved in cell wall biosynthesis